jgi:hypothetical protein
MVPCALDFYEGWWEYHLEVPVQDFVNGVIKLENVVVDFYAGVVGLFTHLKPMLNPFVDGKMELSGKKLSRAI